MKPEDILRPCDYEFYHPVPPPSGGFAGYDKPRSTSQLQADLNVAHDRLKQQVRVNDKLLSNQQHMEKAIERSQRRYRLLVSALVLTWTSWILAVWWVSKVIAPLVVKGLAH